MSIRPLRMLGDPVLRTACEPVTRFDDALGRLVADLLDVSRLQAGAPATAADLVPAAYPDVKPELHALAERSLLAHLYKLVREGRAAENDGRFSAAAASATRR